VQILEAKLKEIPRSAKQTVIELKAAFSAELTTLFLKTNMIQNDLTESQGLTRKKIQYLEEIRLDLLTRMSNMVPRQELVSAREEVKVSNENAELLSYEATKQRELVHALSDRLQTMQEQHDKLILKMQVILFDLSI
jgi:hypothetical protein